MGTAIEVTKSEGVAEVTLIGPGKGNAMGLDFFKELPEVFTDLEQDDAVRAVVVRGKGGIFSYGLDIKGVAPILMPLIAPNNLAKERNQLLRLIGDWQRGFDHVERCSKPVVAAIAGPCIGGESTSCPRATSASARRT